MKPSKSCAQQSPAVGFTDGLDAMEQLRADGWCVILKALPREMGWLKSKAPVANTMHQPTISESVLANGYVRFKT